MTEADNKEKHEPFFGEIEEIYETLNSDFKKGMLLLDSEKVKQHNKVYEGIVDRFPRRGRINKTTAFNHPKNPNLKATSRYFESFEKNYKTLLKNIKEISTSWSVEEDNVLYEEVFKYLMDDTPVKWTEIEQEYFKGIRTRKELESRWRHHLDPLIASVGEWSTEETEILLTALSDAYEKNITKKYIHASIHFNGERSAIQCRNKWSNLNKMIAEKLKMSSSNVTPKMVLDIYKMGPLKIEQPPDEKITKTTV